MLKRCLIAFCALALAFAAYAQAQCTAPDPLAIPATGSAQSVGQIGANLVAQTFVVPGEESCLVLESVTVAVKGSNTDGALYVAIYSVDSAGIPASQIGSSTTIEQFTSSAYLAKTAVFSTPVPVAGGQQYAVVFSQPASSQGSHQYVLAAVQNSGGGYAGGKVWKRTASGGAWEAMDNRDIPMTITFACCPSTGCVYSQGFWKTHPTAWPEFETLNLGNVPYTPEQLQQIMWQAVTGNGLVSLAHQLIAAKLNVLNGAPDSAIAGTIAGADALIGDENVLAGGFLAPSMTSPLTETLDHYNNGTLPGGPPKCVEE